ncbi:MAG: prolipoprotein diacylglyceryl transferase family protein [Myxococcota bacterium]
MSALLLIPWFDAPATAVELGSYRFVLNPSTFTLNIAVVTTLAASFLFAYQHGRSLKQTFVFGVFILAFAFPISRLFNGLFYQPGVFDAVLESPLSIFRIRLGLSMVGGVIGGFVGAGVWKLIAGGSILETGDAFAFGGPFGWCIGRIGCFVTHCHPGRVSDFPLAVADYQVGEPPWLPRHDLGLYGAIVLIMIAILFLWLAETPRKPGFYFALLGLVFPPARFLLDFLRAPASEGGDLRYAGLTPAQYVMVAFFVAGLWAMRRVRASERAPS